MNSFAIRSVEKQVLHYVQNDNIYEKNFRLRTLIRRWRLDVLYNEKLLRRFATLELQAKLFR